MAGPGGGGGSGGGNGTAAAFSLRRNRLSFLSNSLYIN